MVGPEHVDTMAELDLAREVRDLRDLFQRRLLNDKLQRQLYDDLYRQLQMANGQLSHQAVVPLLRQVVLIVDRIEATHTDDPVVESIRQELLELLARQGVVRLTAVGKLFDPHLHQASSTVAVSDAEQDGLVSRELRAGYLIEDRVLRPAEVEVARSTEPGASVTAAEH